ncbi:MAG TPA: heavy metal translocating P-type ATPase, partial [Candidatus Limnocylindrales bacterium]|nr:heavy metal translocating P-type ATPase [Candidatus Limnocylindrales bacterium]
MMIADTETTSAPVPIEAERPAPVHRAEPRRRDGPARLAVALVIVTLVALLGSLLVENLEGPAELVLALNIVSYIAGGYYGLRTAVASLRQGTLDIDLLMILAAAGAAFIDQWHEGATLLFLFSLSNVLQEYALGRSRRAIRSLMKLYPSEANVYRGDLVETVPIERIRPGDVVLIEPGERIPVDGLVASGRSSVDQSPITGESMPVDKVVGDKVFAGSLNQQGALDVEATQPASDTVLARVVKLVEEAQESKAPTERFLDRFEQVYVFIVLAGVALAILAPPLLFGADFEPNFYRAMVLMTVASPCALIISTPSAFLAAIASGARRGVLFKGGAYLEGLAAVKAVAFDKTGTLTCGRPSVTDVLTFNGIDEAGLLSLAAAAEARSEHPLAKAIVRAAEQRALVLAPVEDFQATPGRGIEAIIDGYRIRIGSPAHIEVDGAAADAVQRLQDEGKTVMPVERDGMLIGLVAVADEMRPEAPSMLKTLQERHVKTAMFTGDNRKVANFIAGQLGIDAVHADLMPEDKVAAVRKL